MTSSAYSDVYRGVWNSRAVALKALRIHVDTRAKVLEVSVSVARQVVTFGDLEIGFSRRGSRMEASKASEHCAFPWRIEHVSRLPR